MNQLKHELPILTTKNTVIFPHLSLPLTFEKEHSQLAIQDALSKNRLVVLVLEKISHLPSQAGQFASVGILVKIIESKKLPNGRLVVILEGKSRVIIEKIIQLQPFIKAKIQEIPEVSRLTFDGQTLIQTIEEQFKKCIALGLAVPIEALSVIFGEVSFSEKIDLIAFSLGLKIEEKQQVLETFNLRDRLRLIGFCLSRKLSILQVAHKIEEKAAQQIGKMQKEVILREQMEAIKKELGKEEREEIAELKKKINLAGMPAEAKKIAEKELERLSAMPSFSPEVSYLRTYLDWLVSLPWSKKSASRVEINRAGRILDEDHYGLKEVKERVLEYLAVCKLAGKVKGPILCFVGPPGTGKTSVGQSIARALDRKFIRMSLGGIRDEAEIRGHRRTYVGALPGRIIQGIKTAETKNPVFMLDEIDKIGADFRGDPSSALLEALDPEQNFSFSDHYIEIPFDLSDVMFVTTANILDPIPPALHDRMEVVEFPGYTEEEKFHIAKDFLIPKIFKSHGLNSEILIFKDEALKEIIRKYTREAGVRNLEREISKICRKIAKKMAETKKEKIYLIQPADLVSFLGPEKYQLVLAEKKDEIGTSCSLAWTSMGGEILFIETTQMPGRGNLILTGHLGEVMKESAKAAFSYVRAHSKEFKLSKDFYQKIDLHIHVPAGAIPKDGPSAGIAICSSIVSCLTKRPIKRGIGMTGEITLRGKVLEIGGVKEKVLAARRAGIKTVVLPFDNKKDIIEVPEDVIKDLKFIFVKEIDEVLKIALK